MAPRARKARNKVPLGFEGGQVPLQRRLPKLKGFSNALFKTTYQVVNLDKLGELFPEGGDVTVETLVAKGAVRKNQLVKVLGNRRHLCGVERAGTRLLQECQGEDRCCRGSVSEL